MHWDEIGSVFAQPAVLGHPGTRQRRRRMPGRRTSRGSAGKWALVLLGFAVRHPELRHRPGHHPDARPGQPRTTTGRTEGMVLRSTPGVDDFNAIDPEFVADTDGSAWLAFGSFWGGIKMRRLDPATGKLSTSDTVLRSLELQSGPGRRGGPIDRPARGLLLPVPVVRLLLPRGGVRLSDGGRARHLGRPAPTSTAAVSHSPTAAARRCCAATTSSSGPAAVTSFRPAEARTW